MKASTRTELAQILLDIRYGRKSLARQETTNDLEYSGQTAVALLRAERSKNTKDNVYLAGKISGDLRITGSLKNCLLIVGSIDGGVTISDSGSTSGFGVASSGIVDGDLTIIGDVHGQVNVCETGSITGDVITIGSITGGLGFFDDSSVGGDVTVLGRIEDDLQVWASIHGGLDLLGSIGGNLTIVKAGSIADDLNIKGTIEGRLAISGSVGGDFTLNGAVHSGLRLQGTFSGRADLLRSSPVEVNSLSGASLTHEMYLGEGIDLSQCDFRGFNDFEQLRFIGPQLFGRNARKQISNTHQDQEIPHVELAEIYRQLRQVYERQSNRPGAGDFYYREMNARRSQAWQSRKLLEWLILAAYFCISGYGLRLRRAITTFALFAATGAVLFHYNGLAIEVDVNLNGKKTTGFKAATIHETFLFSVKSMVSFFSPPKADLGLGGQWLQVTLRFLGPTILAQVVLAIRERVAR